MWSVVGVVGTVKWWWCAWYVASMVGVVEWCGSCVWVMWGVMHMVCGGCGGCGGWWAWCTWCAVGAVGGGCDEWCVWYVWCDYWGLGYVWCVVSGCVCMCVCKGHNSSSGWESLVAPKGSDNSFQVKSGLGRGDAPSSSPCPPLHPRGTPQASGRRADGTAYQTLSRPESSSFPCPGPFPTPGPVLPAWPPLTAGIKLRCVWPTAAHSQPRRQILFGWHQDLMFAYFSSDILKLGDFI